MKKIKPFIVLLILLNLAWFLLPLITIAGYPLLTSTNAKLMATIGILVGWYALTQVKFGSLHPQAIYKRIQRLWQSTKKALSNDRALIQPKAYPANYQEAIQTLQQQFTEVEHYLRQHKGPITTHLIMGQHASGKTAYLTQRQTLAHVIPYQPKQQTTPYVLEHEDTHPQTTDPEKCFWYFTGNELWIEVPAQFTTSEVSADIVTPWKVLIQGLAKKPKLFQLAGLTITLNIAQVIQHNQRQTQLFLHLLKQRSHELKHYFKTALPLSIIFTHWDYLCGFREFFKQLNPEQRQQPMGFTFNGTDTQISATQQFEDYLEDLIKRLHTQSLQIMHREPSPLRKQQIFQFPLQMEHLMPALHIYIKQLIENLQDCGNITAEAILFTSHQQTQHPINLVEKKLAHTFPLLSQPLQVISQRVSQSLSKAFFISKLPRTTITQQRGHGHKHRYGRASKGLIIGGALLTVGTFTVALGSLFVNNLKQVTQLNQQLTTLQLLANRQKNPQAQQKALLDIQTRYAHATQAWPGSSFIHARVTDSSLTGSSIASVGLATVATNDSATTLSVIPTDWLHRLQQTLLSKNLSPQERYDGLKLYLMLSKPPHFNADFLHAWLARHPHPALTPPVVETIQQALKSAKAKGITANPEFIKQIRSQLISLPKPYLAYTIVKSRAANSAKVLRIALFINQHKVSVPALFTAKGLQTLFLNHMHSAAHQALYGNFVLGTLPQTTQSQQSVTRELIKLYSTQYMNWWSQQFYSLELQQPKSIAELAHQLQQLNQPQMGLVATLNIMTANTEVNRLLPAREHHPLIHFFRQQLQAQYQQHLSGLQKLNQPGLQQALQQALTQLTGFVMALNQSPNQAATSFALAKQQFSHPKQGVLVGLQNFAKQQPAPMEELFTNLTTHTWRLILRNARHYLHQQWQQQVLTPYQANIAHHFPIDVDAKQDMSLQHFSEFFAPQGILKHFFTHYLAVFINTQQANWQWRSLLGQTFSESQDILITFEKARIITSMFFPNKTAQLDVKFNLQQQAMMPIVRKVFFNVNGQQFSEKQGDRHLNTLLWPGNHHPTLADLRFETVNGQVMQAKFHGPWAWFHLLAESKLTTTANPKKFMVTFTINGTGAKYQLMAYHDINPFIPGIIDSFRLPKWDKE